MNLTDILSAIDSEISQLQQARKLLANDRTHLSDSKPVTKKHRRKMSAASRAKIAAAQKKRWAEQKKTEK
jgi:hypothetical protein